MVTPEAPVKMVKKAQVHTRHQRQAARDPAEQRLGHANQALGGLGARHQVAGEGEQRDRRQRHRLAACERVHVGERAGQRRLGVVQAGEADGAEHAEQRQAEDGQR